MSSALRMFVAGEWVGARSGETFPAESPVTGETIGEVPSGDRADAGRAIEAASGAADAWARSSAFERAGALHRVAAEVQRRRDEHAPSPTLHTRKTLEEYEEPPIDPDLKAELKAYVDRRRKELGD